MKKEIKIREINNDQRFTDWFKEVYHAHFERLYRYAFSITKSKQQAEDVVSEVFLNIWVKKPDYGNIQELSSYLHVSVKHLAIRLISKDIQNFTFSDYDESLQISEIVDPESLLVGKELESLIATTLDRLSPHTRLVYDMVRKEGFSYNKISEELGISKKTIENHMHNALGKLKEALMHHFDESDKEIRFFTRISSIVLLVLCFA